MKKVNSISNIINSNEVSMLVNYAYTNGSDIYSIRNKTLSLTSGESELSIVFNNTDDLIMLLDSFFLSQIFVNDKYDNILIIYEGNDSCKKELSLDNRNSSYKTLFICDDSEMFELIKNYFYRYGYKDSLGHKQRTKSFVFSRKNN